MEAIVDVLFPSHVPRTHMALTNEEPVRAIIAAEVMYLACGIPNNKASRPDGIPEEAVKILARNRPSCLAGVYTRCLEEGTFPNAWKRSRLV